MSLRPLLIDDDAKAKVKRVINYAKEHPYKVGQPVPGYNENFCVKLNTYRCVFTFTETDHYLLRHLSISVPSDKLPNVVAAFMIADLFGFTGWGNTRPFNPGRDWMLSIDEKHHCIVLAQPIGKVGKLDS